MKFLILAKTTKVWGFSDKIGKWIWSNEACTHKDKLVVKCDWQTLAEWTYSQIKDSIKSQWGKYCSVLYIYLEWELCKLEVIWSSLTSFIEAKLTNNKYVVISKDFTKAKKWSNEYLIPVFSNTEDKISTEIYNKAVEEWERISDCFMATKEYYKEEAEEATKKMWAEEVLWDMEEKLKETWLEFAKRDEEMKKEALKALEF